LFAFLRSRFGVLAAHGWGVLGRLARVASMVVVLAAALTQAAHAQDAKRAAPEFVVGPGDILHISVFQNNDLTLEVRVDSEGHITYPFAGSLDVNARPTAEIETMIAKALEAREILKRPQVSVNVVQFRSQQVSVLGQVNRPGRYPLDTVHTLSDILALAGGIVPTGADSAVLSRHEKDGIRNYVIDIPRLYEGSKRSEDDPVIRGGDVVYVHRAPMFYIYGEVQRPGAFRIERDMTVMQALSTGGGPTQRGTQRGIRITRRAEDGKTETIDASLEDRVAPDDVIYVRESLF